MVIKKSGNLPFLHAQGESIPESWEDSVIELYENGLWWHREGPKDKGRLQLDSTMAIEINNPDSDLIMHKYMTCTPEALFDYQMEMLGAKDSWVHPEEESTKWPYHYHERFVSYPGTKGMIDQLEAMIEGISTTPWKRRHQMITWSPERDITSSDPPCLQSIWGALIPNEENDLLTLNLNYRFRTRNVMIAAPMNMVGIWTLQNYIKNEISKRTGWNIQNGRMIDMVDSYHVSAQNKEILEGFIERLKKSTERGEIPRHRCLDKEVCFGYMDKEAIVNTTIEQTRKEFEEKGMGKEGLMQEIEKIRNIANVVSEINGY